LPWITLIQNKQQVKEKKYKNSVHKHIPTDKEGRKHSSFHISKCLEKEKNISYFIS